MPMQEGMVEFVGLRCGWILFDAPKCHKLPLQFHKGSSLMQTASDCAVELLGLAELFKELHNKTFSSS